MIQEHKRICVTIVTYNRKEYLVNLLEKLCGIDYQLSGIYVLDNDSSDETEKSLMDIGFTDGADKGREYVKQWNDIECFYYKNHENTGGSGGFSKVFELAMAYNWDYLWVMDDDVEPEKDCLTKLMQFIDDGARICVPTRTDKNFEDFAIVKYNMINPFIIHPHWCIKKTYPHLLSNDYVRVYAMPFEGPLIACSLIREIGYPDAGYFIFYDDTDYAARAWNLTEIRFVLSAVLHKKIIPSESAVWNWRNYYMVRNSVYFDQKYGKNILVRRLRPQLCRFGLYLWALIQGKTDRIAIITRAYKDAARGKLGKTVKPGSF